MPTTYFFADTSVLCLGGIKENTNEVWKYKIKWYIENHHLKDLNRIDGESMEFEWKIYPRFTTFDLLTQIQEYHERTKSVIQSSSKAGSSSCQCSATLNGEKEGNENNVKVMQCL